MDWIQVITIIGTLGAFTFWLFTKLDADIRASNCDIRASNQRVDQLYQMFIDLLKEGRK